MTLQNQVAICLLLMFDHSTHLCYNSHWLKNLPLITLRTEQILPNNDQGEYIYIHLRTERYCPNQLHFLICVIQHWMRNEFNKFYNQLYYERLRLQLVIRLELEIVSENTISKNCAIFICFIRHGLHRKKHNPRQKIIIFDITCDQSYWKVSLNPLEVLSFLHYSNLRLSNNVNNNNELRRISSNNCAFCGEIKSHLLI